MDRPDELRAGSSPARRGRRAAGRRRRRAACPSRRRRGAGLRRAAPGSALARSRSQAYPRLVIDPAAPAQRRARHRRRAGPGAGEAGRCRSTTARRRTRRRRGSRRGRRDGAAAGGARRARRSTRRSGRGRRPARSAADGSRRSSTVWPSEVSATTSWRAPYRAGRISSVMPASRTTWRPARSRTWSTRATSQPARATRNRPGSIASRRGRRSAGMRVEERRQLPREPAPGRGAGSPSGRDREPAADVERVEVGSRPPRTSANEGERPPDAVAPGVDRAELRPDVEVDAAQAQAAAGGPDDIDRLGQLGLGQAELAEPPRPTAKRGMRLGRDVGVEAEQHVDWPSGRHARVRPAEPARRASRARRPTRRRASSSASPSRGRPDGRPQVGVGLADALERDPRVGDAGRRRSGPLAARDTTFAPRQPPWQTAAMTAGTSFALTLYWRIHGSGNARAEREPPRPRSSRRR